MKAVLLAGGFGTRISEESVIRPKPMVEIGGKPILWHIMKSYSHYGINEFIICCGYKGNIIKEYFRNYAMYNSDVVFDFGKNKMITSTNRSEDWRVTLIDTGETTMTGGRLLRVRHLLENEDKFCFTYGDGLSDVDISSTIEYHEQHGKTATMLAAYPPGRFGALEIEEGVVKKFKEKPKGDGNMVNGGFFVLSSRVFNYIESDNTVWEEDPLKRLVRDGELMAYKHHGFWQPMDTVHDKMVLENYWASNSAPWKKWK